VNYSFLKTWRFAVGIALSTFLPNLAKHCLAQLLQILMRHQLSHFMVGPFTELLVELLELWCFQHLDEHQCL
jgi:hypothetical protein